MQIIGKTKITAKKCILPKLTNIDPAGLFEHGFLAVPFGRHPFVLSPQNANISERQSVRLRLSQIRCHAWCPGRKFRCFGPKRCKKIDYTLVKDFTIVSRLIHRTSITLTLAIPATLPALPLGASRLLLTVRCTRASKTSRVDIIGSRLWVDCRDATWAARCWGREGFAVLAVPAETDNMVAGSDKQGLELDKRWVVELPVGRLVLA
uniref:Uncharacterized protein n=1 Tax=Romanomermis culicivorax TaxID=13658 RepID=A0A915KF57_ROMCU